MSKKPTEKSLSSLANARVRTRLLTVWADGAYCPYDVIPTNMDRRRIISCSSFFSHAWMMAPGRLARLGVESPQMSAYAFRKALLFWMRVPILADDGGPGDRVCRCGSFGPDPFRHHSVACPRGAGILLRHNELEFAMLHMAAECGLWTLSNAGAAPALAVGTHLLMSTPHTQPILFSIIFRRRA